MKVLMKAKAVAILTAFLMVFTMMPLTAGTAYAEGEETSINLKVTNATNASAIYSDKTGNDAQIGDTVDFAITANFKKGVQNYVIGATLTPGLTLVDVQDYDISFSDSSVGFSIDNAYVDENGNKGFKITFEGEPRSNTTVTVKYSAVVNREAQIAPDENINDAFLSYGDGKEIAHATTKTKTYPLQFKRIKKGDASKKEIPGAIFEVYREIDNSNIKFTKITDADYIVDPEGTATEIETVSNKPITIYGLNAENYVFVETEAPQGSGILETSVTIDETVYQHAQKATVSATYNMGGIQLVTIEGGDPIEPVFYDLWVGGTQVTSANCNNIPAAEGYTKYSGKASYNDSTKTLTLHDYNYEGPGGGYNQATGYSVYSGFQETLVIVFEGTNNINTTGFDYNGCSYGVCAGNGELRIMGSGTLNVSAGKAGDMPSLCYSIGISATDSIVIESGTVNATGDTGLCSYGIRSLLYGIAINGGIVTSKASAANEESFGLYSLSQNVTIGENALYVEASGETGAINTVYGDIALDNKISGTGWTDVEGTTGEKVFPAGTYTKGQLAGYKKMVFPEIKPAPKPAPTPSKISGTPLTTMKAGDTSMTITWQKVSGAEGYDIFFSRCDGKGKTTAKKAQTINGNSTFAWTRSGLTTGVSYKAYVKAYVMKNGSKQYVAASPLMHAYTKGYTKRYTNAKSVKVKKTKVSIKKGKTFKIKAKVKKLKKGKKLMPTKHELKLRYLSTDTSIATVSKKGKIKGVKAGTCYVYAYAHNGVFKKIKVTVK